MKDLETRNEPPIHIAAADLYNEIEVVLFKLNNLITIALNHAYLRHFESWVNIQKLLKSQTFYQKNFIFAGDFDH